ncbi:uncharacterized protein LOC126746222 isoform X2 [Anthonomus grandis grandis]|uniref:uncharacterized protein LOC126746222 isoform X2 n=1 Tax=Anthonomus grandis grandis TaxID=2921223 RepID=UPI002164FEAE|nr:uncharacterized protein LOC126746222 isoform X2 [Anthonomus grandis grandis]
MGCVNSKTDINDTHPNIFHVINVNDRGRPVSRGKLEVLETELILHQKGKNPIKWPLRSLRKYGWDMDTDIFSIECGRRSPTGAGYYAFKCRKAEQLFNMVQQYIIGGVQENPLLISGMEHGHLSHHMPLNTIEFPVHGGVLTTPAPAGTFVQRRPENHETGRINSVQNASRPLTGVLSRPGSISSGGQLSPTTISPPPVITELPPMEHNNNKRHSFVIENGIGPPSATYANVGPGDIDVPSHVYMNIDTKEIVSSPSQFNFPESREFHRELSDEMHCYANIDTRDTETLNLVQTPISTHTDVVHNMYMSNSVPCTPTAYSDLDYNMGIREVNYAELDLAATRNNNGSYIDEPIDTPVQTPTQILPPAPTPTEIESSPTQQKKSYATIDFPKTIALSQSIHPKVEAEEGSRKTRHNSTINSFSD